MIRTYRAEWQFVKPSQRAKHEAAVNDVQAQVLDTKHRLERGELTNTQQVIARLDDTVKALAALTPHAR